MITYYSHRWKRRIKHIVSKIIKLSVTVSAKCNVTYELLLVLFKFQRTSKVELLIIALPTNYFVNLCGAKQFIGTTDTIIIIIEEPFISCVT